MVSIIFYVSWGTESVSGIHSYPSRLDFAVLNNVILHHIEKWLLPVQQNLDVKGKNWCRNRIQRPQKIEHYQNYGYG